MHNIPGSTDADVTVDEFINVPVEPVCFDTHMTQHHVIQHHDAADFVIEMNFSEIEAVWAGQTSRATVRTSHVVINGVPGTLIPGVHDETLFQADSSMPAAVLP